MILTIYVFFFLNSNRLRASSCIWNRRIINCNHRLYARDRETINFVSSRRGRAALHYVIATRR